MAHLASRGIDDHGLRCNGPGNRSAEHARRTAGHDHNGHAVKTGFHGNETRQPLAEVVPPPVGTRQVGLGSRLLLFA